MAKSIVPRGERQFWWVGGPAGVWWPFIRVIVNLLSMSCRGGEVEWVKEEVGSPSFGVGQGFFRSSIVQRLVLIIVKNSMDVEKAKADKVGRAGGEEKHVIQVWDHSFTAVFRLRWRRTFPRPGEAPSAVEPPIRVDLSWYSVIKLQSLHRCTFAAMSTSQEASLGPLTASTFDCQLSRDGVSEEFSVWLWRFCLEPLILIWWSECFGRSSGYLRKQRSV